jgi:3alpha(or 20beta)-hydroxysteroid dehydrogenase
VSLFAGTTVLISGGVGGMGSSHVRGFHAEGANVAIADIRDKEGETLAAELGERAHYVHLDVRDLAQWRDAVSCVERRFGPINVLVNNAGILCPASPIEDNDPDDWHNVLAVNLTGPYFGTKAVAPSMRRGGGGSIVNISSTSGSVGTQLIAPYVASKWGLRGLTRTAAIELARDNIRVNAVQPGVIDTPLITEPIRDDQQAVIEHYSPEPFAVPRLGDPDEVTRLILFLSSKDAAYITGTDQVIDGGMLLGPALEH